MKTFLAAVVAIAAVAGLTLAQAGPPEPPPLAQVETLDLDS